MHRSTRGWRYGSSITDPRTGEILKDHVSLGSLRAQQDYLIGEGLLSPYVNGTEQPAVLTEMVVARLRQLSAHEVGHTIGISHNYYDSTAGRISVMDYPHPLVTLKADGTMDLTSVYTNEIGEWDKVTSHPLFGPSVPSRRTGPALDHGRKMPITAIASASLTTRGVASRGNARRS